MKSYAETRNQVIAAMKVRIGEGLVPSAVELTVDDYLAILSANRNEIGEAGLEAVHGGTIKTHFAKFLGLTVKWGAQMLAVG
jgi:hypothetical protein